MPKVGSPRSGDGFHFIHFLDGTKSGISMLTQRSMGAGHLYALLGRRERQPRVWPALGLSCEDARREKGCKRIPRLDCPCRTDSKSCPHAPVLAPYFRSMHPSDHVHRSTCNLRNQGETCPPSAESQRFGPALAQLPVFVVACCTALEQDCHKVNGDRLACGSFS